MVIGINFCSVFQVFTTSLSEVFSRMNTRVDEQIFRARLEKSNISPLISTGRFLVTFFVK